MKESYRCKKFIGNLIPVFSEGHLLTVSGEEGGLG